MGFGGSDGWSGIVGPGHAERVTREGKTPIPASPAG